MKTDCIFCKIASGEIPTEKVIEDDFSFVIRDIHPQAKKHFLVIPKKHIESLDALFQGESLQAKKTVGQLFSMAHQVAIQEGLLPGGFRTVVNTNHGGGQTVFHLHLHVLGGEPLGEKFV